MVEYADVVFGLAWGDEGKGKVTAQLAREQNYDAVWRWAGGNNAGHTSYVDGVKFVTHLVPSGVFYGIPSIVGPGCVVDPEHFIGEITKLDEAGLAASTLVRIDPRCHVVQSSHRQWEADRSLAKDIGTTLKGIGPAYADKAYRTGIRAGEVPMLKPFLSSEPPTGKILCEGAQGIWLDLDWGNYPYVTSSTTAPYGACSIGFSPRKLRHIIGVAKAYDTRVGTDPDFPDSLDEVPGLQRLQKVGGEYGSTTGRVRRCNWLNLDKLVQAVELSGTDLVVINKIDVLDAVRPGRYPLIRGGEILELEPNAWKVEVFTACNRAGATVVFSGDPGGSDLNLSRLISF